MLVLLCTVPNLCKKKIKNDPVFNSSAPEHYAASFLPQWVPISMCCDTHVWPQGAILALWSYMRQCTLCDTTVLSLSRWSLKKKKVMSISTEFKLYGVNEDDMFMTICWTADKYRGVLHNLPPMDKLPLLRNLTSAKQHILRTVIRNPEMSGHCELSP